MPLIKFSNNASTTLSGSISDTQTSITVGSSSNFPVVSGGDSFYATMYELSGSTEINIEIVKVIGTSGATWTVVRGQDGTNARSRSGATPCYIELRLTAGGAGEMLQKSANLSDLTDAAQARSNLGLGSMATQSSSAVNITGGTISGVTLTSLDSATVIADNVDSTKRVSFELSGVSTGAIRTLTVPNSSGTIALLSDLSSGYQPLDSDLTAIAALSASGLVARTGAGAAAARSIVVPASGLSITNADGAAGNPTIALTNDLAAVEAISSIGFVKRTAADTWTAASIVDSDLPGSLSGKTYNGLNLTAAASGFTVAGGTISKTLTVSNTITLAGTDGTTITLPSASGTVPLNNQTFYLGTTPVAINRSSGSISLAGVSIDGSAGSATTATSATSATTATNIAGGAANRIPYQTGAGATGFAIAPTVANTFLKWDGTAFSWSSVAISAVTSVDISSSDLTVTGGPITSTGTFSLALNTVPVAKGGTGATTKTAGFNALTPMTTVGDIEYHDGTNGTRLAGNTTTTKKFLRSTGNGTAATAPAWDTLVDGDLPSALTGKTYNALTLTAAAAGFTIAGGTTSKALTVSNTLTLAGTDASTLNIGSGGTLGSAAFTASTAYAPAAGSTSIATLGTVTAGTWQGSTIGITYGGTGATSKTAAFNALSPVTTLGDIIYGDGANSNARLAGNITTTKKFLTQAGTGTVSAAPGWNSIVDGDIPSALTGKTYNGLTLTSNATGFQIAGGTTSKTLAVSNNLTLAGTDGSTLNIGGGGTLRSAAYTNSSDYASITGANFTGNLGLGSASAGWAAGTKAIDWQYYGSIFNIASGNFYFGQNTYTDGANWKAKATGAASMYAQSLGAHYWYSAASVAGGATQAMSQTLSLDASGNLGVGGSITAVGGGISANGTNATITWQDRNTTTNYWSLYSTSNVARLWSGVAGSAGDKLTVDASGNLSIAGTFSGGSLTNASVTGAKIADANVTPAKLSNSGYELGMRNRIINGNFSINQRAVTGTVTLAAGAYGHDRWKAGASGCTYTFASSGGVTTLTISAGSLQQVIEDVNVPLGTNTCVMSWSGTAQGKIGAGSYGASGVTASVTGGSNLTVEFNTGTLSNVQFEQGSTATPFEYRPYGTELALCQRYFEKINVPAIQPIATLQAVSGSTAYGGFTPFKVTKRVGPTFSYSGTMITWTAGGSSAGGSVLPYGIWPDGLTWVVSSASGLFAGNAVQLLSSGGPVVINASAEL